LGEHQIRWLHITVDLAVFVGALKSQSCLPDNFARIRAWGQTYAID